MHSERIEELCEFCPTLLERYWFNGPLMSCGSAVAIPAVGSLVPGYLLVLPLRHVVNASLLSPGERAEFADFVQSVQVRLSAVYDRPVTMFEHGGCESEERPRSSCVDHAHVHLVPGVYNLPAATPGRPERHDSWCEFMESEPKGPYLACSDADGTVWQFPDVRRPQFYRRVVAKSLGMADHWDYALHPQWENVRRTYADFSSARD
ncbi:HIT family protein [Streptomyces sp. NPDC087420]|uniref:HIT family protein n=1 Tax=Streptomyces sp. NPDC087420 TaxID=3365785 RepID=UPI00383603B5